MSIQNGTQWGRAFKTFLCIVNSSLSIALVGGGISVLLSPSVLQWLSSLGVQGATSLGRA